MDYHDGHRASANRQYQNEPRPGFTLHVASPTLQALVRHGCPRLVRFPCGQNEGVVLACCKMVSPLHLLIVDDQLESLIGLASHLEASGHRLEMCADPLEALRIIARKRHERDAFHLIFCDVNMPSLDGPGVVRELRMRGDNTSVVFVTGYNSTAVRLRTQLESLNALGLLTKPLALGEIDFFIEQVTRRARIAAQERRSSEFGMDTHSYQRAVPGSGSHPLVGNVPSGPTNPDPFYGTSRRFRAKEPMTGPTEGALSRVIRPPEDANIIPDHIVTGRHAPPAPVAQPPRNLRTPLPQVPGPDDGLMPLQTKRKPDPSGFYYMPNEVSGSGPQPGEIPALRPADGLLRDPGAGLPRRPPSQVFPAAPVAAPPTQRLPGRQPSGFYPPQPPLPQRGAVEPTKPGTTSRFRRSVGGPPPGQTAQGTPQAPPSSGLTSRIRRGISLQSALAPAPSAALPSCAVACAHCQNQFTVLIKPESYTVVCVHCGQLNRIDPL